jgi:hypothetical protein
MLTARRSVWRRVLIRKPFSGQRWQPARWSTSALNQATVAALLGHSRLDTARIYVQPDEAGLERAATLLELPRARTRVLLRSSRQVISECPIGYPRCHGKRSTRD